MTFGKYVDSIPHAFDIEMDGQTISRSECCRYLGVLLDSHLATMLQIPFRFAFFVSRSFKPKTAFLLFYLTLNFQNDSIFGLSASKYVRTSIFAPFGRPVFELRHAKVTLMRFLHLKGPPRLRSGPYPKSGDGIEN